MDKSTIFFDKLPFHKIKKFKFVLSNTAFIGQMKKKPKKITVFYRCEQCSNFFEHKFRPQKFCSDSCRRKNKYEKTGK